MLVTVSGDFTSKIKCRFTDRDCIPVNKDERIICVEKFIEVSMTRFSFVESERGHPGLIPACCGLSCDLAFPPLTANVGALYMSSMRSTQVPVVFPFYVAL
eukprot:8575977-Heterocapsa_arctica.AAC.1